MIRAEDYGHTLRCSGCGAYRSLTLSEMSDLDRMCDIKAYMRELHKACDSYHNVAKARAAIKAKIRSAQSS
jgi:hypothetical protein